MEKNNTNEALSLISEFIGMLAGLNDEQQRTAMDNFRGWVTAYRMLKPAQHV